VLGACPRAKFGDHVDAVTIPAPPSAVDWYSHITTWPMYLNDQLGDCVEAEMGHHEQVLSCYGSGTAVSVLDSAVLKVYEDVGGYDPAKGPSGDNPTDNGTNIQDALTYWVKTGIAAHRIAAFAEVDVKNVTELKTTVALFGPLSIGVNLPNSAVTQTNKGQPWNVVKTDGGIAGGHCVALVGYDDTYWNAITWGMVQKVTPAWLGKYLEEAWAPVSAEWVAAQTGNDPDGVDLSTLGDEFAELTGLPDPFLVPPFPQPTPAPAPGPGPSPDQLLASQAHDYVTHKHVGPNKVMAAALSTWMRAKGL